MIKQIITIFLLLICIGLPCDAKKFKKQSSAVTSVPLVEPVQIDEEFTSEFVYFDEAQAKTEAKKAKIQAKIDKKHKKLISKKQKLEQKLQKSNENITKSREYIELLNQSLIRTNIEDTNL